MKIVKRCPISEGWRGGKRLDRWKLLHLPDLTLVIQTTPPPPFSSAFSPFFPPLFSFLAFLLNASYYIYIYYIYDDLVYDDSINAFDWKFERYLSIIGNRLLENFFNETRVCSRPANDLYDFSYRSDGRWMGGRDYEIRNYFEADRNKNGRIKLVAGCSRACCCCVERKMGTRWWERINFHEIKRDSLAITIGVRGREKSVKNCLRHMLRDY